MYVIFLVTVLALVPYPVKGLPVDQNGNVLNHPSFEDRENGDDNFFRNTQNMQNENNDNFEKQEQSSNDLNKEDSNFNREGLNSDRSEDFQRYNVDTNADSENGNIDNNHDNDESKVYDHDNNESNREIEEGDNVPVSQFVDDTDIHEDDDNELKSEIERQDEGDDVMTDGDHGDAEDSSNHGDNGRADMAEGDKLLSAYPKDMQEGRAEDPVRGYGGNYADQANVGREDVNADLNAGSQFNDEKYVRNDENLVKEDKASFPNFENQNMQNGEQKSEGGTSPHDSQHEQYRGQSEVGQNESQRIEDQQTYTEQGNISEGPTESLRIEDRLSYREQGNIPEDQYLSPRIEDQQPYREQDNHGNIPDGKSESYRTENQQASDSSKYDGQSYSNDHRESSYTGNDNVEPMNITNSSPDSVLDTLRVLGLPGSQPADEKKADEASNSVTTNSQNEGLNLAETDRDTEDTQNQNISTSGRAFEIGENSDRFREQDENAEHEKTVPYSEDSQSRFDSQNLAVGDNKDPNNQYPEDGYLDTNNMDKQKILQDRTDEDANKNNYDESSDPSASLQNKNIIDDNNEDNVINPIEGQDPGSDEGEGHNQGQGLDEGQGLDRGQGQDEGEGPLPDGEKDEDEDYYDDGDDDEEDSYDNRINRIDTSGSTTPKPTDTDWYDVGQDDEDSDEGDEGNTVIDEEIAFQRNHPNQRPEDDQSALYFPEDNPKIQEGVVEYKLTNRPTLNTPSSMVLFYTWIIIIIFITVSMFSAFRYRCKGWASNISNGVSRGYRNGNHGNGNGNYRTGEENKKLLDNVYA